MIKKLEQNFLLIFIIFKQNVKIFPFSALVGSLTIGSTFLLSFLVGIVSDKIGKIIINSF